MLRRTCINGFIKLPNAAQFLASHKPDFHSGLAGKVYQFHRKCAIAGVCVGTAGGVIFAGDAAANTYLGQIAGEGVPIASLLGFGAFAVVIAVGGFTGGSLGAVAGVAAPSAATAGAVYALYRRFASV